SRQTFQAWGGNYQNLVAVKAPFGDAAKTKSAPLLIGAHYDTVVGSPGADDNASALAVLLEAALALQISALSRPIWIVAFCLEEQDLLGSRAFVSRMKESGQAFAGAIVLECVGYTDHTPGAQKTPSGIPIAVPTTGDFLGIIGNESSRDLVDAVARSAGRLPILPLVVPELGAQLPDVRRSDHAAFWDQGYPAIMLTDTANFRNPHYHQPTDTIETLDIDFIVAVSETIVAAAAALAGNPHV
ncbi:M28 family peptidase, partial [Petrachloros mirabilis]